MKDFLKDAATLQEHQQKMFKKPKYKKAYDDLELEFQVINLMVRRRIEKKLTQKQLAAKLGAKQPVISQFEQGNFNPSIKFLKRLAKALDSKVTITLS